MSVDPLADLYPSWSPYNYVMADPMGLIDPNGMEPCPPPDQDKECGIIIDPGVEVTAERLPPPIIFVKEYPSLGDGLSQASTAVLPTGTAMAASDGASPLMDIAASIAAIVAGGIIVADVMSTAETMVWDPSSLSATGARRLTADELARRAGLSRREAHELVKRIKSKLGSNPDVLVWPDGQLGVRDRVTNEDYPLEGEYLEDYVD
jgi:hypothetical protein